MKIGLVLSQPPGYSETFFNSKIKGLVNNGVEVILFVQKNTMNYSTCRVISAPKVYKNRVLQALQSFWVLITLMPYANKVRRFLILENQSGRASKQQFKNLLTNAHILKSSSDWLHFGFTTIALNSENVACAIGAKMAVSCRGYDMDVFPLKHKNPYQLLWARVDKVHAISNYMHEKALENGLDSKTKVQIIHPAINIENFAINNEKVSTINKINITTIARLHWIKGLLPTLEALAILKKKGLEFIYQIIGTGPQYEELSFAIHQLGLTDCVELMGKLNHKEIISKLRETDLYIQYSLSEGFCNAVLEAQAMGCLCIVSDGGALPENIIDRKTGWVIQNQQPNQLSEKIMEVIILSEHEKKYIRKNARDRVINEFNLEQQKAKFLKFYE